MYAPPAERHAQPFPQVEPGAPVLPADPASGSEDLHLLASPGFWFGGAVSILCWTGLALAILHRF
jgi:hypothetical protein